MKRTKVLFFSLVLVLFALFFSGVNFKAAEVATSDAISVKGAQVRTSDPLGIRFVGTAEGEYDAYGIAIAFGDVDVNQVVLGATINGKAVLSAEASEKDEDGQYYISLISIPVNMYGQDITARAYVKNGEDVTYATTAVVRNLGQVAKGAYDGGNQTDLIIGIIEKTNYTVSYNLNGGALYSSRAEMAADFYKDFGANSTKMLSNLYIYRQTIVDFYNNAEYYAKWSWITTYIPNIPNAKYGLKLQNEKVIAHTANDGEFWLQGVIAIMDGLDYSAVENVGINCTEETFWEYLPKQIVVTSKVGETELLKPYKAGYEFAGWYADEACTGEEVTSIIKGQTLFAKWNFAGYVATYNLNGGALYSSRAEMAADFYKDFGANSTKILNNMYIYKQTIVDFYNNAEYYAKWSWLTTYIPNIPNAKYGLKAQNDKVIAHTATTGEYWLQGVIAIMDGLDYSAVDNVGINCTEESFWEYLPKQKVATVQLGETELLKPYKSGYEFAGWYADEACTGEEVTSITSNITLYAKWDVAQ